jgi:hypothetical protein
METQALRVAGTLGAGDRGLTGSLGPNCRPIQLDRVTC